MKDMEILSRASAFLLPTSSSSSSALYGSNSPSSSNYIQGKGTESSNSNRTSRKFEIGGIEKKFHVLSASHVVAPWRWPKYYPDEWVQYVNETHTHYTIELRYPDGTFITQSELLPSSYHHRSRDIAVLHIEEEEQVLEVLHNLDFTPLTLVDDGDKHTYGGSQTQTQPQTDSIRGSELLFMGHRVAGITSDERDSRKPVPTSVTGQLLSALPLVKGQQVFARTAEVLTDGMCGGPVLCLQQEQQQEGQGQGQGQGGVAAAAVAVAAAGILEGIVPTNHDNEALRGLAVFAPAADIRALLSAVERRQARLEGALGKGQAEAEAEAEEEELIALVGGEAARHVGADQDPEKLDWTTYLGRHS